MKFVNAFVQPGWLKWQYWLPAMLGILILFLGTEQASVAAVGYQPELNDTDEDGLNDDLEESLIAKYRPHLYYDIAEAFWPSSVTWHASKSQLRRNDTILYSYEEMAANPMLALMGHLRSAGGDDPFLSSSMDRDPENTDFKLNIDSPYHHGETADKDSSVKARKGIFANVQIVKNIVNYEGRGPGDFPNDQLPLILIQYWQFFSYNDGLGNGDSSLEGDHEGDWLYLDVYVRPSSPYQLVAIVYHHHADSKCPPNILTDRELPSDGVPRCYLEGNGHEWWPEPFSFGNPCGVGAIDRLARGNGVDYRVQNVINLGQVFAPISRLEDTQAIRDERQLALLYNGKWGRCCPDHPLGGDPPPGPAIKARSSVDGLWTDSRPRLAVYVDANKSFDPHVEVIETSKGFGSRYFPYQQFEIVAPGINDEPDLAVANFGTVRIAPGAYSALGNISDAPGLLRIARPMRVTAWNSTGQVGVARVEAGESRSRWSSSTLYGSESGDGHDGDGVLVASLGNVEADARLLSSTDAGRVIVGVGCRTRNSDVRTLALHVSDILPDGTLGPPRERRYGKEPNGDLELSGKVDPQYVVIGIGLKVRDDNFHNLVIWSRRLDPSTGLLKGTIVSKIIGNGPDTERRWFSSDLSNTSTILTGFAVRTSGENVERLVWRTGRLTPTRPTQ